MAFNRFALFVCLSVMAFVFTLHLSEGAQRKPPFNGSIFGKRASIAAAGLEGNSANERFYAACAAAIEACSQIYQSSES